MASLLHATVSFTAPELTTGQFDALVNKAEYVTSYSIPALVTNDLLHPGNSVFADLISSHLVASDTQLLIMAEDNAAIANPELPSKIDNYLAAHPSLNYCDSLVISVTAVNTLAHGAKSSQQLILAFGSLNFINAVSQMGLPCIAVATRSQGQTMTDYDGLTQLLQNDDIAAQLLCVCLDSRLIISDLQYDRSTWVVRGVQHAIFHDSQMFHWIEGNFYQLLGEDRTAIDHLFLKVVDKLLASTNQSNPEAQLHQFFLGLWQSEKSTSNIALCGYAQAMTTTLLLCIQYAIQVEALEEGFDARVMFLLKQCIWIAPGNARRLQPTLIFHKIPVLEALGKYEFRELDINAMQNAEAWLSVEAEKLSRAA